MARPLTPLLVLPLAALAGCAGPLQSSIKTDDLPGIEHALAAGADIDAEFFSPNITPVEYACDNQRFDSLKLLVAKGADLSGKHSFFGSPIYLCILQDRLDMVQFLVEHGAFISDDDLKHSRSRPAIQRYLLEIRRQRNAAILEASKQRISQPTRPDPIAEESKVPSAAAPAGKPEKPAAPAQKQWWEK